MEVNTCMFSSMPLWLLLCWHTNQSHMDETSADCGDATQTTLWLFIDEFGQALSQVVQVADFDVQDLDDTSDLDLRLLLVFAAGGQCLFSTLNLILQLGVSSLHILQTHQLLLIVFSYLGVFVDVFCMGCCPSSPHFVYFCDISSSYRSPDGQERTCFSMSDQNCSLWWKKGFARIIFCKGTKSALEHSQVQHLA